MQARMSQLKQLQLEDQISEREKELQQIAQERDAGLYEYGALFDLPLCVYLFLHGCMCMLLLMGD